MQSGGNELDLHIKTLCEFDKMVPIDQIKPNERNPNEHSERQIEIVAKIIQDQGWRHPLIVSNLSGKLVVGHCRLEAAKKLGLSEVPIDFQDFASEQEEMKFMIADNKSASLAEHNDNLMIENIKDLNLESMDFELLGLPDFSFTIGDTELDEVESLVGDVDKKYILEVQFPNDMDMMDVHDDLVHRGYLVKVK